MSRRNDIAEYTPINLGPNDDSVPRNVLVSKVEGDRAQVRDRPGSKLYVVPVERLKFR